MRITTNVKAGSHIRINCHVQDFPAKTKEMKQEIQTVKDPLAPVNYTFYFILLTAWSQTAGNWTKSWMLSCMAILSLYGIKFARETHLSLGDTCYICGWHFPPIICSCCEKGFGLAQRLFFKPSDKLMLIQISLDLFSESMKRGFNTHMCVKEHTDTHVCARALSSD